MTTKEIFYYKILFFVNKYGGFTNSIPKLEKKMDFISSVIGLVKTGGNTDRVSPTI